MGQEKIESDFEIAVRLATPEDDAFIYATWLRHYKAYSEFTRHIKDRIYFPWHHKVIERILERSQPFSLVCTPKNDEHTLLGYLIYETQPDMTVFHFCYVKQAWRRIGVAKKLFEAAKKEGEMIFFTHSTEDVSWIKRKIQGLNYNPYLV